MSTEKAKSIRKEKRVKVMGSGHGGGSFTIAHRKSTVSMPATINAANEAFTMAGIKRDDIDVLECHDCFSFTEIMNIEDLGFVEKGKGGPFTADGHTTLGGKLPVNTSGGLSAKGHPIGATGVGQIVEMTFQLRDESDKRQVKDAKYAMTHVLGWPRRRKHCTYLRERRLMSDEILTGKHCKDCYFRHPQGVACCP